MRFRNILHFDTVPDHSIAISTASFAAIAIASFAIHREPFARLIGKRAKAAFHFAVARDLNHILTLSLLLVRRSF